MAKHELIALLNIGKDHQQQYGVPLAKQDEVFSVDEEQAKILVGTLKCAKPYNAEEEAKHREAVEAYDEAVIANEVQMLQSRMDIEAAAKDRFEQAKAKAKTKSTTSHGERK